MISVTLDLSSNPTIRPHFLSAHTKYNFKALLCLSLTESLAWPQTLSLVKFLVFSVHMIIGRAALLRRVFSWLGLVEASRALDLPVYFLYLVSQQSSNPSWQSCFVLSVLLLLFTVLTFKKQQNELKSVPSIFSPFPDRLSS